MICRGIESSSESLHFFICEKCAKSALSSIEKCAKNAVNCIEKCEKETDMGKCIDLVGKKYARLMVIERSGSNAHNKALWKCRCECGSEVTVIGSHLLNGNTHSCGCYKRDITSERLSSHRKSRTRLYHIWKNMRQRCYNPNKPDYKYYGGKGIIVDERWSDYSCFEKWAVENGYNYNLTIDRIDLNGNYCPENCRWVTMTEQARNMSRNRIITYNGESHCLSEWGEILGISAKLLGQRINKYGWSIERAFTTPIRCSGGAI